MLTIAIIDKYPMIRKGLKYYFHDHFDEVNVLEADSVTSFRNLYPFQNPDLTILGSNNHSDTKSMDLINQLKKLYSGSKIIIYDEQSNTDPTNISRDLLYLTAGVNGYLSKQSSAVQMMNCVKMVLKTKTMHFFE